MSLSFRIFDKYFHIVLEKNISSKPAISSYFVIVLYVYIIYIMILSNKKWHKYLLCHRKVIQCRHNINKLSKTGGIEKAHATMSKTIATLTLLTHKRASNQTPIFLPLIVIINTDIVDKEENKKIPPLKRRKKWIWTIHEIFYLFRTRSQCLWTHYMNKKESGATERGWQKKKMRELAIWSMQ